MNSPEVVKSGVPEKERVFPAPHVAPVHDLLVTTGNQSYN